MSNPSSNDLEWLALVRAVRNWCVRHCQAEATGITIHHNGPGPALQVPFKCREPDPPDQAPVCAQDWASGPAPKHLSDFRAVYWPGAGKFVFSEKQALVVKQLWEAYEIGSWEMDQ